MGVGTDRYYYFYIITRVDMFIEGNISAFFLELKNVINASEENVFVSISAHTVSRVVTWKVCRCALNDLKDFFFVILLVHVCLFLFNSKHSAFDRKDYIGIAIN